MDRHTPVEDPPDIAYHPLAPDRWDDLETLFGQRGACGGCWCMWWRSKRSDFDRAKGEGNREAFHALVSARQALGILAYVDGVPVGWCGIAPRETLPALERSRVLKRVDDQPVWSVNCFFVARPFRRRGLTAGLLRAAVAYAAAEGAQLVEGYPVAPRNSTMPDVFAWTGLLSAFEGAGFVEVARRSETRPIVRHTIPRSLPE
jgi:GNAT superfamily N-acetyltransferase